MMKQRAAFVVDERLGGFAEFPPNLPAIETADLRLISQPLRYQHFYRIHLAKT